MTGLYLKHSSHRDSRLAISLTGLEPRRPIENNYSGAWWEFLRDQPEAVYARDLDDGDWLENLGSPDVWHVFYCGPAMDDPKVTGFALLGKPQAQALVTTGND